MKICRGPELVLLLQALKRAFKACRDYYPMGLDVTLLLPADLTSGPGGIAVRPADGLVSNRGTKGLCTKKTLRVKRAHGE